MRQTGGGSEEGLRQQVRLAARLWPMTASPSAAIGGEEREWGEEAAAAASVLTNFARMSQIPPFTPQGKLLLFSLFCYIIEYI